MTQREVTIEPADNGFIVRHYEESTKKDEPGRTIRRVAASREEALKHAGAVLGCSSDEGKKHKKGEGKRGGAEGEDSAPETSGGYAGRSRSRSASRRRSRPSGRR